MPIELALSRRQVHDADRLGGIELVLLWPAELGTAPRLAHDERRLAAGSVQAWAHQALARAVAHHGLVILEVHIACLHVPAPRDRRKGYRPVIAVHLAAERWAEASRRRAGLRYFAKA